MEIQSTRSQNYFPYSLFYSSGEITAYEIGRVICSLPVHRITSLTLYSTRQGRSLRMRLGVLYTVYPFTELLPLQSILLARRDHCVWDWGCYIQSTRSQNYFPYILFYSSGEITAYEIGGVIYSLPVHRITSLTVYSTRQERSLRMRLGVLYTVYPFTELLPLHSILLVRVDHCV